MLLTKSKPRRRRTKSTTFVSIVFDFFGNLFPLGIIFIFALTFDRICFACGPGGGGGGGGATGGGTGTGILGRNRLLSQAVDGDETVSSESGGDGKLIWDINQWVPSDFRSASDQSIIASLNPNLRNAFGDIAAKPLDSGTASTQPIVCPSDLNCDFSNWRLCRWKNNKQDEAEFYIGEGSVDADRLQLYTGTRITPSSPFLLTAANRGEYKTWLVSDVIPEQPGDGTVEFRFWLTPLVELRVCTRNIDSIDLLTCSDSLNLGGAPGPALVTIPGPIREPFEIVFEVKNFVTDPGGVAFIDDITYTSTLCDEVSPSARIKIAPTGSKVSVKQKKPDGDQEKKTLSICEAVPCSFDGDKTCGYALDGPGATSAWRVTHGPVGNRATGIQRDVNGNANSSNSYLLASGEHRGLKDLFVAQTPSFHLDRPVSIRFFRHLLSSTSQLRVCLFDSTSFCPVTFRIDVDALDWQESLVDLNPADIPAEFKTKPVTILFVAEGLKQNNFIGIDNIEVRERNGSPAC